MDVQQGYDQWAAQYDTDVNRTRDLEAIALRSMLENIPFENCLEIGCGTGKNTGWLSGLATTLTAVDLSEEMLAKAKEKTFSPNTRFICADITKPWEFGSDEFDLVSFSLVLEHIPDLHTIFGQCARVLKKGGHVYIGELHPFKQYNGSKARFETPEGTNHLPCYTHHISEFTGTADKHGFSLSKFNEYFDYDDKGSVPRILTIVFRKK
ncbi:MAG: class I SAM-dependent methyltransferase [Ferruginibacter sp.]